MRVVASLCLAWCALGGCEAPPAALPPADLAPGPDVALPRPVACGAVRCLPPACCGGACQKDADCCGGTICGAGGRCVPASCASCGDVGCVVDFQACTATCATPACCLKACNNDGDCCPATRCRSDAQLMKRCMPTACDVCTDFRPLCEVTNMCKVSCHPPPTCGKSCLVDTDCGARDECRTFLNGMKLCVPQTFEAACNACGPRGCLFHAAECSVECAAAADMNMGMPTDAGAPADAAAPTDAAVEAGAGNCAACCAACAADGDCCPGHACRPDGNGRKICTPGGCSLCAYGCSFTCP